MHPGPNDVDDLIDEHLALLRQHGQAQTRCSDLVVRQSREIARLQAQVVRLRAAVIVRDTARAWQAQRHAGLDAARHGSPRRLVLADRAGVLIARVQELLRERWHEPHRDSPSPSPVPLPLPLPPQEAQETEHAQEMRGDAATTLRVASTADPVALRVESADDLARLEDSLVAADLVICQTGCLSHGAYWRVRDHCGRTGKTCVLVEEPDALRIVRIHPSPMLESPLAPPM